MPQNDTVGLFVQLFVLLAVALTFGQLARKLRLLVVVGEITGGILLGPTFLGTIAPSLFHAVFPAAGSANLSRESIVNLGMLLFLFVAGLELDLDRARQNRATIAWTSVCGILAPFGLGIAFVFFFPGLWGAQAATQPFLFTLFIGTALSISALPVIARILVDLDLIGRDLGTIIMASASIDDLVGWSLFGMVLSNLESPSARNPWVGVLLVIGLLAVILVAGRRVATRILHLAKLHLPWPGGSITLTVLAVLALSALTEAMGIHAFFGAFLVGAAMASLREQGHEAIEIIRHFVTSLFAPLYFVSIGLQTSFAAHFDLPLVLLMLIIACVGKIGGATFGARMAQVRFREALAIGFGMNARGAMGMILASAALENGLIDERVFVALIVMAVATSLLSGPAIQRLYVAGPDHRKEPARAEMKVELPVGK